MPSGRPHASVLNYIQQYAMLEVCCCGEVGTISETESLIGTESLLDYAENTEETMSFLEQVPAV